MVSAQRNKPSETEFRLKNTFWDRKGFLKIEMGFERQKQKEERQTNRQRERDK
jgi:hypothetical protein